VRSSPGPRRPTYRGTRRQNKMLFPDPARIGAGKAPLAPCLAPIPASCALTPLPARIARGLRVSLSPQERLSVAGPASPNPPRNSPQSFQASESVQGVFGPQASRPLKASRAFSVPRFPAPVLPESFRAVFHLRKPPKASGPFSRCRLSRLSRKASRPFSGSPLPGAFRSCGSRACPNSAVPGSSFFCPGLSPPPACVARAPSPAVLF
jgi:hypothetical protein